jgi:ferrous iron transport protein A
MARSLAELETGAEARVTAVGGERSFRRRLMEMGFLPGTRVRLIRRVELGGLLEFEVRRSRVTVREGEAHQLHVTSDL